MDLRERRELNNGFGAAMSRAFEMAATPAIFAGLGWLLDRQLGTRPLVLLVLFFFAIAGVGYMTWRRYEDEMQRHEADAVWSRKQRRSSQDLMA